MNSDDLFLFRPFTAADDDVLIGQCHAGAVEKLQTLFPGQRLTIYDLRTIGITSDSLYCPNGMDTFVLGMVDDELPAMRRESDQQVFTFRLN